MLGLQIIKKMSEKWLNKWVYKYDWMCCNKEFEALK